MVLIRYKLANFGIHMKLSRNNLFIAISSVALLLVLIIQLNWLLRNADIKEELFNEKANLVLARTTDALLSDKIACKQINDSIESSNNPGLAVNIGKPEIYKIDSLLNYYMKFYSFNVNYSFELRKSYAPVLTNERSFKNINYPTPQACYERQLDNEIKANGFQLKLNFPRKRQFVEAEMSKLFITSVILVLIVLLMFWRTILLLMKEKKISDQTTDFLNNMTHEFKTPLTNISLAGRMMIKDSNIGQEDKIRQYSGIILEENEKLGQQVEQVLNITAIEKGEIPLQKNELDFHKLITDSLKYISLQIEYKEGKLKLDLNAEHFVISGDRVHLTNAICNLIDNAIKYSIEKPDLIILTSNIENKLVIEISDKGIGIEKEYQQKVFDKFFRVPTGNVHDVKGFGLGLAYVKNIIELHNGTIEVRSQKDVGTTFIISLPYV